MDRQEALQQAVRNAVAADSDFGRLAELEDGTTEAQLDFFLRTVSLKADLATMYASLASALVRTRSSLLAPLTTHRSSPPLTADHPSGPRR